MNTNFTRNLIIIGFGLFALHYGFSLIFPPVVANSLLTVIFTIIGIIIGRSLAPIYTDDLFHTNDIVESISKSYKYLDLFAVVIAVNLLGAVFISAFDEAISDMLKKEIISFGAGKHGYAHLYIYTLGFITVPMLILTVTWYGIKLGRNNNPISFGILFFTFAFATLIAKLLLHLTGQSGFKYILETDPKLPIGTIPTQLIYIIALSFTASFAYSVATWAIGKLTQFIWSSNFIANLFRPNTPQ